MTGAAPRTQSRVISSHEGRTYHYIPDSGSDPRGRKRALTLDDTASIARYLRDENEPLDNLGFTCPRLAHLPQEDPFEVLGIPEFEALARVDGQQLQPGVPKQLVKKADWENWIDEDDEDIRLIDFGEAFVQGLKPDSLAQPADLRAPETNFTDCFDHRLDLWRAGITVG